MGIAGVVALIEREALGYEAYGAGQSVEEIHRVRHGEGDKLVLEFPLVSLHKEAAIRHQGLDMSADAEFFGDRGGVDNVDNIDLLVLLNGVQDHGISEEGLLSAALNAELVGLPFVVEAINGGTDVRNAAAFGPDVADENPVHVVGGDYYNGGASSLALDLFSALTTSRI